MRFASYNSWLMISDTISQPTTNEYPFVEALHDIIPAQTSAFFDIIL